MTIIDATTGEIIPVNNDGEAMVIQSFNDIVQQVITQAQFSILSGKTPEGVIRVRPGKGGKSFRYIPHGYIVKVLNQAFGLDWSFEITPQAGGAMYCYIPPTPEKTKNGNPVHNGSMVVHGRLTVRVRDPENPKEVIAEISKSATGEKEETPGQTWGAMIKSAESDALKRCAARLGIGNDLYFAEPDEMVAPLPAIELTAEQVATAHKMQGEGASRGDIAAALGLSRGDLAQAIPDLFS